MTDNTPTEEDVRKACAPKSNQLNFEDCQNAPLVVRITAVTRGDSDQPIAIHLDGHMPYRPCKTMRRILVSAWGSDARQWVGRMIELYGDPTVKYGGVAVGGIRIGKLSDISQAFEMPIMVSRGKRVLHRVDVLASRLEKSRAWLAAKGLSEADAVAVIGGRKLEDATDEDWATLRAWAAGATESKGQRHG